MYDNYLLEKLDDINRLLRQHNWLLDYQLFLQSVKELRSTLYETDLLSTSDTIKMGFNLQVLSKSRRFSEYRYSLSSIDQIREIREPGVSAPSIQKFPGLRAQNSTSIRGDYSKSVDMDRNPTGLLLKNYLSNTEDQKIPFYHDIQVSLENRVIHNQNAITLIENSLRTSSKISAIFSINDFEHNLSRSRSGRSLDLDIKMEIENLVAACETRFTSPVKKLDSDPVIILHPHVLGSLLANYFFNINLPDLNSLTLFNPNIQVYDDPLLRDGYYSHLFDDQGITTRSIPIVEDGVVTNTLSIADSEGDKGGNGYRNQAFQPRKRSYEHDLVENFTNIVVTGGAGAGIYFQERPGSCLVVRNGYVSPGVSSIEGYFILYVTEADVYKDGKMSHTISNLSMRGSLKEILSKAHFSADISTYVDPSYPIQVNTGWIGIPPSLVSFQ